MKEFVSRYEVDKDVSKKNKILRIVDKLEDLAGLLYQSPSTETDFIIRRGLIESYYKYRDDLYKELDKIDFS